MAQIDFAGQQRIDDLVTHPPTFVADLNPAELAVTSIWSLWLSLRGVIQNRLSGFVQGLLDCFTISQIFWVS